MTKPRLENWNPSIKVITFLICAIMLSFGYVVPLNLFIFGICLVLLILFSDAKPKAILSILIPALVAALGLFIMGLYYAKGNTILTVEVEGSANAARAVAKKLSSNILTAMQISSRLLAFSGMGILFALTTDNELFISSLMHQCRLSPKFAYGILAAFHLMPGMVREFKAVRTAFAVRGIDTRFSLSPLFTMLVNSIRWSESVAMAMESKGFNGTRNRTYYTIPTVHISDYLLGAVFVVTIAIGMYLGKR